MWIGLLFVGFHGSSGIEASKEKGIRRIALSAEGPGSSEKFEGVERSGSKRKLESSGKRRLLTEACPGERTEIAVAEPVGRAVQ